MVGHIQLYLKLKPSVLNIPDYSFYKLNGECEFQLLVPPNNREPYIFTKIFEPNDEEGVNKFAKECAECLISGTNSSVLAIGAIDSGKTHTIFGSSSQKKIKKSLSFQTVSTLFESLRSSNKEKSISLTLNFIEIFNEKVKDLGLAYYKRTELHLAEVAEKINQQDLEIKEAAGRSYVEDACIIQILNANELLEVIAMGLRVKEHLKSDGDCVLCITLSQRYKNEVQSARLYFVDFQSTSFLNFSEESSLSSLQKVLNKVNLANLGVPVKSIPFKINKIMYLLQGSILNSIVTLILNLDTDPNKYKESSQILNYSKSVLEIDKKIKMSMKANTSSSRITEWAKRLNEEIADLDQNIKKTQSLYEEKLRLLSKIIGIDEDLELLASAEKGSREYEICKKFREALQTVNNLKTRNEILEKKLEKYNKELNDLNLVQASNTDKNRRQLISLNSEIRELKHKIEDCEVKKEISVTEKLMLNTENLEKMLYESHFSLEEGSALINTLKVNIENNTTDLKNLIEAKDIVKSELENEFKVQIIDNDFFNKQQLISLEDDFKDKMREKYQTIFKESHQYAAKIRELDLRISEFQKEAAALFEVARLQGKAIYDVENGKFNKGISPVLIPRTHIPPVPSKVKFPLIFSALGSHALEVARVSSKLKSLFSYKKSRNQSSIISERTYYREIENPGFSIEASIGTLMNTPLDKAGINELRTSGGQLQKIIKKNCEKFMDSSKNIKKMQDEMDAKQSELEKLTNESEKYKEQYQSLIKKRLDETYNADRNSGKTFLTDLSRPGSQKNIVMSTKMLRNVYTTVSGHRLPMSYSQKPSTARPLTSMDKIPSNTRYNI